MKEVLQNQNFLGAFLLMISMVFIGYFMRRKNIITAEGKKSITALVFRVALPCMAFSAFMHDFSSSDFVSGAASLIAATIFYIVWIAVGRLLFSKLGKRKAVISAFMISLGQLTLFSLPLMNALGSDKAMLYASIMTLAFRGVLYFVAFTTIAGAAGDAEAADERENAEIAEVINTDIAKTVRKKAERTFSGTLKKVLLTPVMIAMIAGMIVWLCQGFLPKVNGYCVFRIDKTLPAVYKVVSVLSDMVSPLAMLLIGADMGENDLRCALRDRYAWIVAAIRTVVCPVLVFLTVRFLLHSIFDGDAVMALTLGFAAPSSVTVNLFCSTYHYEEEYASHITVASTLLCILTVPLINALITL